MSHRANHKRPPTTSYRSRFLAVLQIPRRSRRYDHTSFPSIPIADRLAGYRDQHSDEWSLKHTYINGRADADARSYSVGADQTYLYRPTWGRVREIEFVGHIAPIVDQTLFFRMNGHVRQVNVKFGSVVTAGQVLADLEMSDLENQLAQSRTALKTSELQSTVNKPSQRP